MPRTNAVFRNFLCVLVLLVLNACSGSGMQVWDQSARTQPPAEQAPGSMEGMTGPETPHIAPAKVAILVPLSGKHSELGQAMLNASQMALFDVGYENFEIVPRDTKGTAQGAAEAARSALAEGAQLILGPVFSEEVKVVKPLAAAKNVNVIAFSTDWSLAGGNTFILGFMPFDQVERIVSFAASRNIRRIGALIPASEYGRTVSSAYDAMATRTKLQKVPNVIIQPEKPSAKKDIERFAQSFGPVADSGADAVLVPFGGQAAVVVSGELSRNGLSPQKARRLGTGLLDDAALAINPSLQGAWFAAPAPRQRMSFEQRYAQNYNTAPPRLSTLAYDATALASVLARRGPQAANATFDRGAIMNPNGFAGLDGIFRFRPNGMAERGLAVLEFRNGQVVVVDPSPSTFQRQ
ncbi:MAG: penicillin-binding protein activator [Alphaproteobacteria bacterium]|nr:penicillin-binding protein activator [Alphaproteobacteria bacterium]